MENRSCEIEPLLKTHLGRLGVTPHHTTAVVVMVRWFDRAFYGVCGFLESCPQTITGLESNGRIATYQTFATLATAAKFRHTPRRRKVYDEYVVLKPDENFHAR